ncbi:MAG: acyltransferase [Alistipes sp.]|nr:acyltransferase [Alistipes sp.]
MISIEQIIHSRTGQHLPRWAVYLLRRLLHEQRINLLLKSGQSLPPADFLRHVFRELEISSRVRFLSNLPASDRYIFVANHPFGALDGMLLADMLLREWSDVGVVVNDLLMHIEPLRPLWIPVNKFGRQSHPYLRLYHEALLSPTKQILTFPAGLCSRFCDGRVTDLEWRDRFVRDAERYDRRIVPVYVDGILSQRFYRLARLRQALGIRFNVELLLLASELFSQRGSEITITLSRPIDPHTLPGTPAQKCQLIRHEVYAMG